MLCGVSSTRSIHNIHLGTSTFEKTRRWQRQCLLRLVRCYFLYLWSMSDTIKTGSSARVKGGVGNIVLPGNGMKMEDVIAVRMK